MYTRVIDPHTPSTCHALTLTPTLVQFPLLSPDHCLYNKQLYYVSAIRYYVADFDGIFCFWKRFSLLEIYMLPFLLFWVDFNVHFDVFFVEKWFTSSTYRLHCAEVNVYWFCVLRSQRWEFHGGRKTISTFGTALCGSLCISPAPRRVFVSNRVRDVISAIAGSFSFVDR